MTIKNDEPVIYKACIQVWENSWAGQMTRADAINKVAKEWGLDPKMLDGKYAVACMEAKVLHFKI